MKLGINHIIILISVYAAVFLTYLSFLTENSYATVSTKTLSVNDIFNMATTNSPKLKELKETKNIAYSNYEINYSIYDPKLDYKLANQTSAASSSLSAYESVDTLSQLLSIKKQHSFGIRSNFEIGISKSDYRFGAGGDPITISPGVQIPAYSAEDSLDNNPEHLTSISAGVEIDLYRNFLGKQLDAEAEYGSYLKINADMKLQTSYQNFLANLESLVYKIFYLKEQKNLVEGIISTQVNIIELYKKRIKLGRSDEVDLLDARNELFSNQALSKDIGLELEKNISQLNQEIGLADAVKITDTLEVSKYRDNSYSVESSIELALKNRRDYTALKKLSYPLKSALNVSSEKTKADLRFFYEANFKDYGESFSNATENSLNSLNHTIGIKVTKLLGDTASFYEKKSNNHSILRNDSQILILKNQIISEIESLHFELKSVKAKIGLYEKQLATYKSAYDKQITKLKQARATKLAPLKYEIAIYKTKEAIASSRLLLNMLEVKRKLLTHSYPLIEQP